MVGCGRPEPGTRQAAGDLPAVTSEVATNRTPGTHWAVVRKSVIESAISEWCRTKINEGISAETLSPEEVEKLRQFESLNNLLGRMQMRMRGMSGVDPATGLPERSDGEINQASEKERQALEARVEQARVQIASVLERRAKEEEKIRNQFTPEKLVAEYAGNRFDLVIDSSDSYYGPNRGPILYQSGGEVLDITDGVLKLFNLKIKP